MLFHSTIFGPIHSRRLGVSLGVNLEPDNGKICSFDCVYCECGLNEDGREDTKIPTRAEVKKALENKLVTYIKGNEPTIDNITFAGNGEPTMHPDFNGIIDDTIELRNRYTPETKISVLSNAWHLSRKEVFIALRKVDNNILKLDSAITETVLKINRPVNPNFNLQEHIDNLSKFNGNCTIQTLFLRGNTCDNTTPEEIKAWLDALKIIQPKMVQIYSLDRKTPYDTLQAVPLSELKSIEVKVRKLGLNTLVVA